MGKKIVKIIAILILIAVIVGGLSVTILAFTWPFSKSTTTAVSNKETQISDYEEYLTKIQEYIDNIDTTNKDLDETKVEIFDYVEELQEEYDDTSSIDMVTNQILSKMLYSSSTNSSDLTSSLSSTLESLLGDTSVALESLTPNEVLTINSDTAGEFAGEDYDVTLSGNVYYADESSSKWVVLVHGFMMTGQAITDAIGQMYIEQGYNIFAPDLRGWGDSEGSVAMGYLEMLDVYDWIKYLNANYDCDEIIVHGISLGGATVLQLSGYEDSNGKTISDYNVIGIVDDCGYTSMVGIIQDLLETVGNSELISKILSIANFDLEEYQDYDTLKDYIINDVGVGLTEDNFDDYQDSMNSLSESSLPILIIHGTGDSIVPFENSDTVYETAVNNTKIPYIQRFEAEDEDHAFILMGTKANVYEGHVDNFIEVAEDVADGKTVTRISTYEEKEEESTSFITKLINSIKLIKNIFGF